MREAVSEARQTMRAADQQASAMASILRGRLRHVPNYVLDDLKRELRDYNMNTGKWKSGE